MNRRTIIRLPHAACLWLVLWGTGSAVADTPSHADVRYGQYHRNLLDVYAATSDAPTPVLIYFHGGGWMAGDKRRMNPKPFLANGITVVSANYRFTIGSPDAAPYPAQMNDGTRVVQFVRSRAKDWNINPDRVALMGASAGAVMSMWIGYHDDLANPQATDPIERISSRVQCVLPVAGPTTMDVQWIRKHVGGPPHIHPAVYPFFQIARLEDLQRDDKRELAEQASPITHVTADDPPTFLQYFSRLDDAPLPESADWNETVHHARFGQLLKERLDAVKVPAVLHYIGAKESTTMNTFLETHLQKKP